MHHSCRLLLKNIGFGCADMGSSWIAPWPSASCQEKPSIKRKYHSTLLRRQGDLTLSSVWTKASERASNFTASASRWIFFLKCSKKERQKYEQQHLHFAHPFAQFSIKIYSFVDKLLIDL